MSQQQEHSVAIIVPYRSIPGKDKFSTYLIQFVTRMNLLMTKAVGKALLPTIFQIFVVEQSGEDDKFNRGILLNIGYEEAKKRGCDIFIFHDVDLIPNDNDELLAYYVKYPLLPIHIAKCWDRYTQNPKYLGGILSMSGKDFEKTNGFPNNFYGWGGEDDELALRLKDENISIENPQLPADKCIIEDLEQMDLQQKLKFLREDDSRKNKIKLERLAEHNNKDESGAPLWRKNGLFNLERLYAVVERGTGNGGKYFLIRVTIAHEKDVPPPTSIVDMLPPPSIDDEKEEVPTVMKKSTHDKNTSIYSKCLITKPVVLDIKLIKGDLRETLKSAIASAFEGKCAVEGYVKPNSCEIVSYSCGVVERGNTICFVVAFECMICFPVEGQDIECVVKNITKAGVRAEVFMPPDSTEKSPIVLFVARDHYYKEDIFSNVKVNESVLVTVIGQRFELNDKYVSVIGKLKTNITQKKSTNYQRK